MGNKIKDKTTFNMVKHDYIRFITDMGHYFGAVLSELDERGRSFPDDKVTIKKFIKKAQDNMQSFNKDMVALLEKFQPEKEVKTTKDNLNKNKKADNE